MKPEPHNELRPIWCVLAATVCAVSIGTLAAFATKLFKGSIRD